METSTLPPLQELPTPINAGAEPMPQPLPEANPEPPVVPLDSVPGELPELVPPSSEDAAPTEESSRLRSLGRATLTRTVAEVVGAGVDIGLIGVGNFGVDALRGIAQREAAASAADIAVLNKLQPQQVEREGGVPPSRARKLGRGMLNFTIMAGTAYMAQKYGPELAEHINDGLNQGAGEVAVPLTSKVAAITGVNSLRSKLGR